MKDVKRIAQLNDAFRRAEPNVPGKTVLTIGILALLRGQKVPLRDLARTVAQFDTFAGQNDPHGERDFGSFDFHGELCFWKIDLYEDPDVKQANRIPVVTRVLTIMLASEY